MGDGLKHAILEALCSRGPWQTDQGSVDAAYLHGIYEQVAAGQVIQNRANRRNDRAFQLLRKAGLIEYSGTPKAWRVT